MTDYTPGTPALTPENWRVPERAEGVGRWEFEADMRGTGMMSRKRHAVAALALHGQPFGFTWEDVDALKAVVDNYLCPDDDCANCSAECRTLWTLAQRIADLLPPR